MRLQVPLQYHYRDEKNIELHSEIFSSSLSVSLSPSSPPSRTRICLSADLEVDANVGRLRFLHRDASTATAARSPRTLRARGTASQLGHDSRVKE